MGPHGADLLGRMPEGRRQTFDAGAGMARPDSDQNLIFIVETGTAKVWLNGENRDLVLSYLRPGSIFVTHTRAWVEAVDPCTIRAWPVPEMLTLIAREPQFAVSALREIGLVLAGALNLIEDLAFRSVEARLARFLLAERATQASDQIRLIDRSESLAAALGTSRQTLSTLLNKLIRDGVVRREDRASLVILDPARLEDLATLSAG